MNRSRTAVLLAAGLFLCGCRAQAAATAEPTAAVTSAVPTAGAAFASMYTGVGEDNAFVMADRDQLTRMLEHGTGVVFLGFPECPWCQAYVPYLDQAAQDAGVEVLYYNIYADKTEDHDFYLEVAGLINDRDSGILSYDNSGSLRIYMPLVLFLDGGRIVGYDHETCTEDSDVITPSAYWTQEKADALVLKLTDLCKAIAARQAENDQQGCDSGCSALAQETAAG